LLLLSQLNNKKKIRSEEKRESADRRAKRGGSEVELFAAVKREKGIF
jgi:hypothetical protein